MVVRESNREQRSTINSLFSLSDHQAPQPLYPTYAADELHVVVVVSARMARSRPPKTMGRLVSPTRCDRTIIVSAPYCDGTAAMQEISTFASGLNSFAICTVVREGSDPSGKKGRQASFIPA